MNQGFSTGSKNQMYDFYIFLCWISPALYATLVPSNPVPRWSENHGLAGGGAPPLSWGFFPYAAISVLQALQHGLAKRAQLKVSVVEIYLDPWRRLYQQKIIAAIKLCDIV